ncbi:MAG: DUF1963 domain-containing protein [Ruminococcaceae bacterium]|nr:DUF1963 domain-containing protein [Oscillospiraceae bacterium]
MSIFDLFRKKEAPVAAEPVSEPSAADAIRALVRNEIALTPDADTDARPDGSKIGGLPYLPADFTWPTFTDGDGQTRPLSFFCQIDLTGAKPYDRDNLLPAHGLLVFFYDCESFRWGFDPTDKGAARVFYFPDTVGFAPCTLPEGLYEGHIMPELALTFAARASYPAFEELEMHSDLCCDWEAYEAALAQLGIDAEAEMQGHKLLGYANVIQGEMLTECERVTRGYGCGSPADYQATPEAARAQIRQHAADWLLLLQLDTIEKDDFQWMFGDCGMLYYYIRKQDLAAGNFGSGWFSMQCY